MSLRRRAPPPGRPRAPRRADERPRRRRPRAARALRRGLPGRARRASRTTGTFLDRTVDRSREIDSPTRSPSGPAGGRTSRVAETRPRARVRQLDRRAARRRELTSLLSHGAPRLVEGAGLGELGRSGSARHARSRRRCARPAAPRAEPAAREALRALGAAPRARARAGAPPCLRGAVLDARTSASARSTSNSPGRPPRDRRREREPGRRPSSER